MAGQRDGIARSSRGGEERSAERPPWQATPAIDGRAARVLRLQRAVGNRATARLLARDDTPSLLGPTPRLHLDPQFMPPPTRPSRAWARASGGRGSCRRSRISTTGNRAFPTIGRLLAPARWRRMSQRGCSTSERSCSRSRSHLTRSPSPPTRRPTRPTRSSSRQACSGAGRPARPLLTGRSSSSSSAASTSCRRRSTSTTARSSGWVESTRRSAPGRSTSSAP